MSRTDAVERRAMGIRRPGSWAPDVVLEDCPKRVRTVFAGKVVVDSTRVRLMHERGHLPVYYFPLEDIRAELLVRSDATTHCPRKGDARYWSVRVGDRVARDALWNYPDPIEACPDISGLAAIYWDRMDAWFEEDEQVFVHPRDPYTRIDVLESSRHVEVKVGDLTVAETRRPVILFETGLPPRYYLPILDVRMDRLRRTDTATECPYKGVTSAYWSVEAGTDAVEDAAWCYRHPYPEVAKIAGRVAFFNERVDLYVDGEIQERPRTRWSRPSRR